MQIVKWLPHPFGTPAACVQYQVTTSKALNISDCVSHESENRVIVGIASIWEIKEPLRKTITLAVTPLIASREMSAWRNVLKKTAYFN